MKLNRGEPDHSYWKTPFSLKEKANAWLGIGVCGIAIGISRWTNPPKPPFTGRWGWISSIGYETFGEHGPALVWFIAGALVIGIGLSLRIKFASKDLGG